MTTLVRWHVLKLVNKKLFNSLTCRMWKYRRMYCVSSHLNAVLYLKVLYFWLNMWLYTCNNPKLPCCCFSLKCTVSLSCCDRVTMSPKYTWLLLHINNRLSVHVGESIVKTLRQREINVTMETMKLTFQKSCLFWDSHYCYGTLSTVFPPLQDMWPDLLH